MSTVESLVETIAVAERDKKYIMMQVDFDMLRDFSYVFLVAHKHWLLPSYTQNVPDKSKVDFMYSLVSCWYKNKRSQFRDLLLPVVMPRWTNHGWTEHGFSISSRNYSKIEFRIDDLEKKECDIIFTQGKKHINDDTFTFNFPALIGFSSVLPVC